MGDPKEDVQHLFRYEDDGIVEVRRWIMEVPCDAFGGLAKAFRGVSKACQEGKLKEDDLP